MKISLISKEEYSTKTLKIFTENNSNTFVNLSSSNFELNFGCRIDIVKLEIFHTANLHRIAFGINCFLLILDTKNNEVLSFLRLQSNFLFYALVDYDELLIVCETEIIAIGLNNTISKVFNTGDIIENIIQEDGKLSILCMNEKYQFGLCNNLKILNRIEGVDDGSTVFIGIHLAHQNITFE